MVSYINVSMSGQKNGPGLSAATRGGNSSSTFDLVRKTYKKRTSAAQKSFDFFPDYYFLISSKLRCRCGSLHDLGFVGHAFEVVLLKLPLCGWPVRVSLIQGPGGEIAHGSQKVPYRSRAN